MSPSGPRTLSLFLLCYLSQVDLDFVLMVYKLAVGPPNISYTSMVKAQRKEEEAGPAAFSPCIDRSLPEAPAANWPEQATRPPTLGRS